jgi:ATP-dependent Lon protease
MTAYPLLPIRDLVVFPGMRLPLYVGRRLSVGAVSHPLPTICRCF